MNSVSIDETNEVDLDECKRLQEEEIMAMESIYPETFTWMPTYTGTIKGNLSIELIFDSDRLLLLHSSGIATPPTPPNSSDEKSTFTVPVANASPIRVKTLPPIVVHYEMPQRYPLGEPLRLISWECKWWLGLLPDEQAELKADFCTRMNDYWNSNHELMLFETEQMIKDIETLFPLNLVNIQIGSTHLSQLLIDFNTDAEREEFSRSIFKCGICLEEKRGKLCRKLVACGHVFCNDCIEGYFSASITEGAISQVRCPDPGCLRFPRRIARSELQAIVGKDHLLRLEWLEEKARMDADPTITYCPRKNCGGVVKKDLTNDKLGICLNPKCQFAFCLYCKKTWHGNYRYCKLEDVNSLVREYKQGDAAKREALEIKYGKKAITKMIQTYEEEALNEAWKAENTTSCSVCEAPVVKNGGCNHMTCSCCRSHFCFLCGFYLHPRNVYAHYSEPSSSCYNRLFEGMIEDEFIVEL